MRVLRKGSFKLEDLVIVAEWHGEVVNLGDFVRLNSGSPLGLVTHLEDEEASVTWLTNPIQHDNINRRCLRPVKGK